MDSIDNGQRTIIDMAEYFKKFLAEGTISSMQKQINPRNDLDEEVCIPLLRLLSVHLSQYRDR